MKEPGSPITLSILLILLYYESAAQREPLALYKQVSARSVDIVFHDYEECITGSTAEWAAAAAATVAAVAAAAGLVNATVPWKHCECIRTSRGLPR